MLLLLIKSSLLLLSSEENALRRKHFLFRSHSFTKVELSMNGEYRKEWRFVPNNIHRGIDSVISALVFGLTTPYSNDIINQYDSIPQIPSVGFLRGIAMKWAARNIWPILCALAIGTVLLLCTTKIDNDGLFFSVSSADGTEQIAVFEGDDGIHYLFLPSYAQMEKVRIVLGSKESVTIGGRVMTDGMHCGDFQLNTDYLFSVPNKETYTLRFCRAANVAAVHIDTAT